MHVHHKHASSKIASALVSRSAIKKKCFPRILSLLDNCLRQTELDEKVQDSLTEREREMVMESSQPASQVC